MTIYSDKRLPKKGELRDNFCNFDRNRIQLFNEGKVYDSLTDAGLFRNFQFIPGDCGKEGKQMKEIISVNIPMKEAVPSQFALTLWKKMGKDGWRKNGCIRK